jgi:hypothetical protein
MSLFALKEWLGHRRLESTQWYAAITPDKLTQAYLKARYFERNVAVVQVLLDRAAIEDGSAAKGEAYKYVHLGMVTVPTRIGHNVRTAWPASGVSIGKDCFD